MRSVGLKVLKNKLNEYVRLVSASGQTVELACYGERLLAAARAMRFGVVML